jgi:hypothetical protein
MTQSSEDLEERLRRVLNQAARQLQVPPVGWQAPSPTGSRRQLRRPALGELVPALGVAIAVLVAVLAVALIGHRHTKLAVTPNESLLSPPPAVAVAPRLSPTDSRYISAAGRATFARDPACRGFHGPEVTNGSPSRAVTSMFAILHQPTTPAAGLRSLLHWTPGAQLYANQIRHARSALGASFYVVPAGNVSGQRGVPARCTAEQIAALTRQLSHVPEAQRAGIRAAQSRYLAYLHYLALHADGVCAGYPTGRKGALVCATVAEFHRWGVLVDATVYLDHAAVFWTVVPDGVATVTLRFVPAGSPLTHTVTTTVRPVNNVVVAKEPYDAPNESGFPSTIELRAADGHLIKKTTVTPNMPTVCGYGC